MFKKEQGKQIVEEYIESERILKRYIKGNLLGKGGFAKCYEFISQQTNRKYAAKIIQKSSLTKPKAKQKLQSQIKIHKSLNHHNIVNFEHFFQDDEYVYILLELCRPETLNDLLKRRKRITEFETKYYIHQITEALKYVHGRKVIHRDLKLGNLFLTDQLHIKVGDFGLATKLTYDGERKKTTCGTPNYLAPQILISKTGHSYEVDVWSIGIIAYTLLFGRPPFETNDLKLTYSKIKTCNYSFPDTVNVSPSSKRFITKILQLEPHRRPTLQEILQDEFITSIQIPKTLPLATISIPPSANLMAKYEKASSTVLANNESLSTTRQQLESSANLNSYRTLDRNKIMMSTDKLQTYEKKDVMLKRDNSRENLCIQRAASTAGLLQRKNVVNTSLKKDALCSNVTQTILKQNMPIRVIYFEQNPKFGVAYMLSTNACGMRYNDSTCIVTNSQHSQIKYITLESTLRQVSSQTYLLKQAPQTLAKKVKIINHYIRQLKKKKTQTQEKMPNQVRIQLEKMRAKQTTQNALKTCIVCSLKTSKAQFFQFNNDKFQVIFEDGSQVIFLNKTNTLTPNLVTYINKFSQLKQFEFSKLEEQSEDVKKRMNYALNTVARVKKSLEFKENQVKEKENKYVVPPSQSVQKEKVGLGRSSSTMKLTANLPQSTLTRDTGKNYSSTARLTTISTLTKASGQFALKQISNRIY